MGGINHQPTGRSGKLAISTMLSNTMTSSLSACLKSNSLLEDAMLTEMTIEASLYRPLHHASYFVRRSIREMQESLSLLDECIDNCYDMIQRMRETEFHSPQLIAKVSLDMLGEALYAQKMIPNQDLWKYLSQVLTHGGFEKLFKQYIKSFEELKKLTQDVIDILGDAEKLTKNGSLVWKVERNEFRLRQPFAKLFTAWNNLFALFLSSAMASTEIHLTEKDFPSLATEKGFVPEWVIKPNVRDS